MYVTKATADGVTLEVDDDELDLLLNGCLAYSKNPVYPEAEYAHMAGRVLGFLEGLTETRTREKREEGDKARMGKAHTPPGA